MLRLQLLPETVFEGARIKRAVIVCVVIFLVIVGITHFWQMTTKRALTSMTEQAETAAGFASQTQSLQGEIAAVEAEIAPIDAKRDYMIDLKDFGEVWTTRMRQIAPYIYPRAELLSLSMDAEGFEMELRTSTTEDVARVLMNLKQLYGIGLVQQDSLNVTGLTGWPNLTSPLPNVPQNMALEWDLPGLVPVNSNSQFEAEGGTGGGGEGFAEPGMEPGMEAGPGGPAEAAPPAEAMPGEPGMEGMGGGGGGGSLGQATVSANDAVREKARVRYIRPSTEPPPQPYLRLQIRARWAEAISEPGAAATAAPGGMPGDPGMMEGMPPEGPPMEGPPPEAAPPADE